MYIKKLIPKNPKLTKRLITEISFDRLYHQIRRNLKTNLFQDAVNNQIVPNTLYIDLTYNCNRKCNGCYTQHSPEVISKEFVQEICQTAYDSDISYVAFMGGEPLLPKTQDIVFDTTSAFPRLSFAICTNGDYLDKTVAKEFSKLHNLVPLISIDGLKDTHNARRGEGSYEHATQAMQYLKEHRVFFGHMTTIMPENKFQISSPEFIQTMIDHGCLMSSYTLFISEDESLTPAEYDEVIDRLQYHAKQKPIYIMSSDFGYLGNEINRNSKILSGITISPTGEIKTERSGNIVGKISSGEELKEIILSQEIQNIFKDKIELTSGIEYRDQRLGILKELNQFS